jgi:hypothetical protein
MPLLQSFSAVVRPPGCAVGELALRARLRLFVLANALVRAAALDNRRCGVQIRACA